MDENKEKFLVPLGDHIFKHKKQFVLRTTLVVDKSVYQRFLLQRSQQIPIDCLLEKALNYANEVKLPDFKASDGWLEK